MCGGLWSRECRARFGLRRCRGSGRVVWKVRREIRSGDLEMGRSSYVHLVVLFDMYDTVVDVVV